MRVDNRDMILKQAVIRAQTLEIDLWYPRIEGQVNAVELGLVDVRAADSILITYDFHRDGWVIKQARQFAWELGDEKCDRDWQEVAFVQAWARERTCKLCGGTLAGNTCVDCEAQEDGP